ncbi:hypothetical protein F442_10667 [Phytophthora nicotianae P10297]|uniref:Uncharacterized protein n=1 Tax=Phytophthora nicotianae P10297 TaxID=1317064 RepID=W2Z899_PHYNI|nr:hypothetical protein F442_10667 [Phytophthora nicotianae P10297]
MIINHLNLIASIQGRSARSLLKRGIKKITSRSLHKAGISKNKANVAATDESLTAKAATSVYKISQIVSTHFDEYGEEMAEVEWFHTFEPLDDLPQAVKDRVVKDKKKKGKKRFSKWMREMQTMLMIFLTMLLTTDLLFLNEGDFKFDLHYKVSLSERQRLPITVVVNVIELGPCSGLKALTKRKRRLHVDF